MALFSLHDFKSKLPFIRDRELFLAVSLAGWLILEKNLPLRRSIDTASRKYNIKPKNKIEKILRINIPGAFFLERQKKKAQQLRQARLQPRTQDCTPAHHTKDLFDYS